MKFTPAEKATDPSKVRAFIDKDGALIIVDHPSVIPATNVCLMPSNLICTFDASDVADALQSARQVFFEGDSITVTF